MGAKKVELWVKRHDSPYLETYSGVTAFGVVNGSVVIDLDNLGCGTGMRYVLDPAEYETLTMTAMYGKKQPHPERPEETIINHSGIPIHGHSHRIGDPVCLDPNCPFEYGHYRIP
jgi:hypothetical protein